MTDISAAQWNAMIADALQRTEFLTLATHGTDGLWTCTVQFSYDKKGSIFFKSKPDSLHMTHIKGDPKVAAAIYSTTRPAPDHAIGLQLRANARVLTNRPDVENAARYHYARSSPSENYQGKIDLHLGSAAAWNFVAIEPTELWYFDSRHFEDARIRVPLELLALPS